MSNVFRVNNTRYTVLTHEKKEIGGSDSLDMAYNLIAALGLEYYVLRENVRGKECVIDWKLPPIDVIATL